ncbi:hypothetical protein XELAEV_18003317mg [Xenopus laevis]|uniref:Uncharacterized protein n=1 Tax=Xenopus laevis TaxID=8355 RepID=A0A974GY70_XENLA|nr:hypothetical protein XELAEV_18003317mg [Xenopus laevis]
MICFFIQVQWFLFYPHALTINLILFFFNSILFILGIVTFENKGSQKPLYLMPIPYIERGLCYDPYSVVTLHKYYW